MKPPLTSNVDTGSHKGQAVRQLIRVAGAKLFFLQRVALAGRLTRAWQVFRRDSGRE
jgi:hypothetical protein